MTAARSPAVSLLLRQVPRGAFLHVEVHTARKLLHRGGGTGEVDLPQARVVLRVKSLGDRQHRVRHTHSGVGGNFRYLTIEVLLRHIENAAAQVSPGVRFLPLLPVILQKNAQGTMLLPVKLFL